MSSWSASGSTWISSAARPACAAFGASSDRRASATGDEPLISTCATLFSRNAAPIASLRRRIETFGNARFPSARQQAKSSKVPTFRADRRSSKCPPRLEPRSHCSGNDWKYRGTRLLVQCNGNGGLHARVFPVRQRSTKVAMDNRVTGPGRCRLLVYEVPDDVRSISRYARCRAKRATACERRQRRRFLARPSIRCGNAYPCCVVLLGRQRGFAHES